MQASPAGSAAPPDRGGRLPFSGNDSTCIGMRVRFSVPSASAKPYPPPDPSSAPSAAPHPRQPSSLWAGTVAQLRKCASGPTSSTAPPPPGSWSSATSASRIARSRSRPSTSTASAAVPGSGRSSNSHSRPSAAVSCLISQRSESDSARAACFIRSSVAAALAASANSAQATASGRRSTPQACVTRPVPGSLEPHRRRDPESLWAMAPFSTRLRSTALI